MLLHEKLKGYNLILLSASPRRKQMLRDVGLSFTTLSVPVEEIYPEELPAEEVAAYLSRLKADAYPYVLENKDIVITADTTVITENAILGKPINRQHAIDMLFSLSGKKHRVVTGVTFRADRSVHTFKSISDVWFRELNEDEIIYYVDNFAPYDKAGAYGIQEWIGYIGIERIEGSFYNIVGLPIQKLYIELNAFLTKYQSL